MDRQEQDAADFDSRHAPVRPWVVVGPLREDVPHVVARRDDMWNEAGKFCPLKVGDAVLRIPLSDARRIRDLLNSLSV